MNFREVKKGDWIINFKAKDARPWYVAGKFEGMVLIKRNPRSKLLALAPGQLRMFKEVKT